MRASSVARTDTGRQRYNNEDCFFADDEAGLYGVADGVGGSNAGEIASRIFCDVLAEHRDAFRVFLTAPDTDGAARREVLALMDSIFQRASERIYHLAQRHAE